MAHKPTNSVFSIHAQLTKLFFKLFSKNNFVDVFLLREYHILCISMIMGGDFYGNGGTNKKLS